MMAHALAIGIVACAIASGCGRIAHEGTLADSREDEAPSDSGPVDSGSEGVVEDTQMDVGNKPDTGTSDPAPDTDAPDITTPDAGCDGGPCPPVAQIALGGAHTCARLFDGTLRCWGYNVDGRLGDGTTTSRSTPTPVPLTGVAEIALGSWGHTCARLTDGTVRCWGSNSFGQLGDGTTTDRLSPTIVIGLSGVTGLALGREHTCARLTDGTVECWGYNSYGQLGDGMATARSSPALVAGLSGVEAIALVENRSCARLTDGTAKCWGANDFGELGDGTTGPLPRYTPTAVKGLSGVADIALGYHHACARLVDGTAKCWGTNYYGELGDGTTGSRSASAPVLVVGLSGIAEIALGIEFTCARFTDGTMKCWGHNLYGKLGDGTTTDRAAPTLVTDLSNVAEIALGGAHTCARIDRAIECWGFNGFGQVGDGTGIERHTPTFVAW